MNITFNIYYRSNDGKARKFVDEMISSGIVAEIKSKKGNLRYDYYYPVDDNETVLLIDTWDSEKALDEHHKSLTMDKIASLRNKYDLHMTVEKHIRQDDNLEKNNDFIRK